MLPVYSRADLSRTVMLRCRAVLDGGLDERFRARISRADTQSEDYPTVQALRYMGA
jgi:hypothetical protein